MDVEAFIAPRDALLTDGRLTAYHGWEERAETSLFVTMAVRRCTYRKAGLMAGEPLMGSGVKAASCVRTEAGWRFAPMVWQDVEDGLEDGTDFIL